MRKWAGLLFTLLGAVLVAVSAYAIEANGCWVLYRTSANWPPSYEFWCIRFEPIVSGALIFGLLLIIAGVISGTMNLAKRF